MTKREQHNTKEQAQDNAAPRPETFAQFVGQTEPKKVLEILVRSARKQGKSLAHCLLSGASGLGKTTLVRILAREMGANLIEMVGSNLQDPRQLQAQLATLRPHDILFIDEIHALGRDTEECLYSAMEDGVLTYVPETETFSELMKAIGAGSSASRAVSLRLPQFTLVGATTLAGLVSAPLRSRFVTSLTLEPYSIEDLTEIVTAAATKMSFPVHRHIAVELAKRSRNTARLAVGHLMWFREFCFGHDENPTLDAVKSAFALKGIDDNGLTKQDRQYLSLLVNANAPVGLGSLAASMNESVQTLEQSVEPFLMREGYIRRGTRGRITPILRSHGWVYLAPLEKTEDGFTYPLVLKSEKPASLQIATAKGHVVLHGGKHSRELKAIAGHMLSLDFPLEEFQALCKQKKATALLRLAKQGWGRMLRSPAFWEDAVKTLCTTNASWGYTEKMCRNLCEQLGETTPSGMKTLPTPGRVLKAGERFLKEKVGMGYRSKSLMLLAKKAGEVPWLLDFTAKPDAMTAEKEIQSWHGFGMYATRHLLVLMGFHEYLPIDREVGSHLGIRKAGDKGSNLDSDHFEDWGKFRFTAYKLSRVAKRVNWIGD